MDEPKTPYETPQSQLTEQLPGPPKITWKEIVRDSIIIMAMTALGGFVIGIATAGSPLPMIAIAISNMLFSVLSFFLIAFLVRHERFAHFAKVILVVWVISAFNIFLVPSFTAVNWLFSVGALIVAALVGGGIGALCFRKKAHH